MGYPKISGGIRKVGISQLFCFRDIPSVTKDGIRKAGKRDIPNVTKDGLPGSAGEGAALCHNGFTNSNSPLWVNY